MSECACLKKKEKLLGKHGPSEPAFGETNLHCFKFEPKFSNNFCFKSHNRAKPYLKMPRMSLAIV